MNELKLIEIALKKNHSAFLFSRGLVASEKLALTKSETALGIAREAQIVLQEIASTVQQEAHKHIAFLVSRCLSVVFDKPYEFRIEFEQKRGKTDARLFFVRDEVEIDPMTGAGGGVVDVASFALRLACLSLARPRRRKLLVLDEPFRFVSCEYHDRVREMLEMLSKELEIQIIMVTHIEALQTGKVIEI